MIRITIEGLDELLLKVFGGVRVGDVSVAASAPASEPAATTGKKNKKADAAPTPDPIAAAQAATAPPAATGVGLDAVRAVIVKASAQGKLGAARTVEIIQETCGCKKASEIPADRYGDVIAALEAQLDLMD